MTRSVTIALPDSVAVTLRGSAFALDTSKLPENVILALFEKGVQRGSNDPLGAVFDKGADMQTPANQAELKKYWAELVDRWNKGEVAKARSGGVGRTTDPVLREVKRLANAEIDNNIKVLLENHKVTRKEFDESYRAKYLAARIAKDGNHFERLEKEAKANLAKLSKSANVELMEFEPKAAADEPKTEDETGE